jgi:hypothetical protein
LQIDVGGLEVSWSADIIAHLNPRKRSAIWPLMGR